MRDDQIHSSWELRMTAADCGLQELRMVAGKRCISTYIPLVVIFALAPVVVAVPSYRCVFNPLLTLLPSPSAMAEETCALCVAFPMRSPEGDSMGALSSVGIA